MINALKKDKKFLIFICCLIIIPILLIVFLIIAQSCSNKKLDYGKYEFKMESAAKKYLGKKDNLPKKEGEYVRVDLDTLVENSYIDSPKKALNDDTCDGYVSVRKGNKINYVSVLNCDSYKTDTISEHMKLDLTTEGEGLYLVNGEYIFKGLNVNNYVTLGEVEYRAIGITKDNGIKLLKVESENTQARWDWKYNIKEDRASGINLYKDSNMLERLNNLYTTSSKIRKIKSHLIPITECVYAKNSKDRFLDKSVCKEEIENQYISLLSIDDYMNASLDSNCVDLYSKSCRNYNYLGRMSIYTWTKDVVAENDYQVYYISSGLPSVQDANYYNNYNIVLYLDGDEVVQSGNGSKQSPYVIK